MHKPAVVIIVNWCGAGDTIDCLISLREILRVGILKAIVIDNASPRRGVGEIVSNLASSEYFKDYELLDEGALGLYQWSSAPLITVVRAVGNHGFAGGNNIATKYAMTDRSVDVFWYLNNDTVIKNFESAGSLIKAVGGLDAPFSAGSVLVHYDRDSIIQAAGCEFSKWTGGIEKIQEGDNLAELDQSSNTVYSYIPGASLAVNRQFLDRVGLMAEEYFLYFEELDWVERARRFGISPPVLIYSSVICHKEGGSIGTKGANSSAHSLTAEYYLSSSYVRFYLRHHTLLIPVPLLRLALKALRSAIQGDIGRSRAILKGVFHSLRRRP